MAKLTIKLPNEKKYVECTPYYIRLPHREAVHAAVDALLNDGASFRVTASGATASITITDTRSWSILEQVKKHFGPFLPTGR